MMRRRRGEGWREKGGRWLEVGVLREK